VDFTYDLSRPAAVISWSHMQLDTGCMFKYEGTYEMVMECHMYF
jgi:hypothetical protein